MTSAADIELAEARGRREAYETIRTALATEQRGAPYNAPARTQVTYIGGLARARRIVEGLFWEASAAEEALVMRDDQPT